MVEDIVFPANDRPLLIDCDPGVDDAIALIWAFAAGLNIVAITTLAGNVDAQKTALNAARLAHFCGRLDVPIYAGSTRPLLAPLVSASHVHGVDGMGGLTIEGAVDIRPEHAVLAIIDHARAAGPKGLDVITLGPMTNVAMALRLAPDIATNIGRVIAMGGADKMGNITPKAEYNIYADPEAADIVLRANIPLLMIGLNITHQARITQARLKKIENIKAPQAQAVHFLGLFANARAPELGEGLEAPLHDPCPIGFVLDPTIFDLVPAHIRLDLRDNLARGQTNIVPNMAGPHYWANGINADKLFARLTADLDNL